MTTLWPSGSEAPPTTSPAAAAVTGQQKRGWGREQVREDSDRKVEIKDTEKEGTQHAEQPEEKSIETKREELGEMKLWNRKQAVEIYSA